MKKSKLFLSLMSLCFSLAVLCFGVYAAGQVDYTISGTISYIVEDAYIEMHTAVYTFEGEDMPTSRGDLKALADLFEDQDYSSFSSIANSNDLTQVGTSTYNSLSGANSGVTIDDEDVIMEDLELTLDTDDHKAYVIVVNIQNLGDNNIYARLSGAEFYAKTGEDTYSNIPMTSDAVTMSNMMRYNTPGAPVIEKNDTVNLVYVFGIEDVTIQIADMKFDYSLEIKNGAYHPNDTVLNYDLTNNYYYVKMGTYGNGDNNDIRWRLISVDGGLTKYTAPVYSTAQDFTSASLPTGDCVFIQETNTMTSAVTQIDDCDIYLNGVAFQANYKYTGGEDRTMPSTAEQWQQFYAMEYDNGEYVFKTDNNGNHIKANDYSVSTIRQYINGTNVYKHVNWQGYWDSENDLLTNDPNYCNSREIRSDENFGYSSMLSDYNIANDNAIYTQIVKRSLKDMYKGMSADWDSEDEIYLYNNIALPITNTCDAFWLLSMEELTDLMWEDQTNDRDWSAAVWHEQYWWLRSPNYYDASYAGRVDYAGDGDGGITYDCNYVARAAFQLAL